MGQFTPTRSSPYVIKVAVNDLRELPLPITTHQRCSSCPAMGVKRHEFACESNSFAIADLCAGISGHLTYMQSKRFGASRSRFAGFRVSFRVILNQVLKRTQKWNTKLNEKEILTLLWKASQPHTSLHKVSHQGFFYIFCALPTLTKFSSAKINKCTSTQAKRNLWPNLIGILHRDWRWTWKYRKHRNNNVHQLIHCTRTRTVREEDR